MLVVKRKALSDTLASSSSSKSCKHLKAGLYLQGFLYDRQDFQKHFTLNTCLRE